MNFALYSRHATAVFLILFDAAGVRVTDVIRLDNRRAYVWHAFVHGVGAGQQYGYRVCGPWDPSHGHRFNERKLLVDPYAKALHGKAANPDNLLLAYDPSAYDRDLVMDTRDDVACVPRSVVIDDAFDWQGVEPPDIPLERLVIYEVHVKGFTAHPSSGARHPGTYLGFIDRIPHLQRLGVTAVELAARLTGSADLYGDDGRSAYASVNFITCHDGFTLWDLVSYDRKHNEANLEGNRDGADDNASWNSGAEGETTDPAVLALRHRLVKNHVCALLFAAGTPMLLGGDEMLRTQRGNNNAYCQDNELGWLDWTAATKNADMLAFVTKAIALTRRFTILQRRKFFQGTDRDDDGHADITWYGPDLGPPDWGNPQLRTLAYLLDGGEEQSTAGKYLLFVILNADPEARWCALPPLRAGQAWRRVIDTSLPAGEDFADPGREVRIEPADHYIASARSTVVLLAQ